VRLFIDRLPFSSWTDQTRTPPHEHWSVVLPVLLGETEASAPPAGVSAQEWSLDTAYDGEAFAWRHHLQVAGLDADDRLHPQLRAITTSLQGEKDNLPVRTGAIWLVSNIPMLRDSPWRLELEVGIVFQDTSQRPDPHYHRPLIGTRALMRAGVKVELDFGNRTVSVWTPDGPDQVA
jgi:hypothetical protein